VKNKGRIFLLDDDELIVSMLARALKKEGYEVRYSSDPEGIVSHIREFAPDAVLLDIKLPGANGLDILRDLVEEGLTGQVIMLTSDDSAETAVTAMKRGAVDYLTKPFDLDEVKIVVGNVVEKRSLKQEVSYLRKISSELIEREIIGDSPAIRAIKEKAAKLAEAGVPSVMITGESGTGKEMFARFTHRLMFASERQRYAPFVEINCAALPEHLIESELFGHRKGAFTDATTDKQGLFELAHRGSILLDEIAEMDPALQTKLLRVLEERTVRRIGGHRDIPIEVTVFATTNKDLNDAVRNGEFRMDLYYRLNAFSLHIPPLRERREDVPALAQFFLEDFAGRYKRKALKGFSEGALDLLRGYDWPGNVRELRNVVERIVVLEPGEQVLPEQLPKVIRSPEPAAARAGPDDASATAAGRFALPDEGISLEQLERDLIAQALEKTGGNKREAARLLNMTYDSLRYQIKKFGLE
jgi:DNA-binding NtrC family response regulator